MEKKKPYHTHPGNAAPCTACSGMGRRPGLRGMDLGAPGGLPGCESGSAARPIPSLDPYGRALRPARVDGPGHCLRGTPVRTHCFGCFQLALAPPGPSQGTSRRSPPLRPPPTADTADWGTCPAEPPTFQEQPPTPAAPGLPPAGPPLPSQRRGLPAPGHPDCSRSECDGTTLCTPGLARHLLAGGMALQRVGRGRPRGAEQSGDGGGAAGGRGSPGERARYRAGDSGRARGASGGARRGAPWGPARAGARPLYLRLRLLGHFLARRRPGLN